MAALAAMASAPKTEGILPFRGRGGRFWFSVWFRPGRAGGCRGPRWERNVSVLVKHPSTLPPDPGGTAAGRRAQRPPRPPARGQGSAGRATGASPGLGAAGDAGARQGIRVLCPAQRAPVFRIVSPVV